MKADVIVIERPEKQSWLRRAAYAVLTIIAWVAWGFLWLPALHALAEWLGLGGRFERWLPDTVLSSTRELEHIIWLAPLSLVVFAIWAVYDGRIRRAARQRRRLARPVPLPAAAETLGTSTREALRMQTARRVVLHVDDEGHVGLASAQPTPPGDTDQAARARRDTA